MTTYFSPKKKIMPNQSNQYSRLHYSFSLQTLSCLITFIILIQGPIIIVAQSNQYESVIALNNNIRSSSATSTVVNNNNNDGIAYDEIYDDSDGDHEEMLSSSSPIPPTTTTTATTTISNLRTKVTPNLTSNIPALTEEAHNGDYADAEELDAYQNEDHHDPETTNQDDSQLFDEKISINDPDQNSVISDPNNRKNSNLPSSRIPFVPSNLWRDLFSKPGILVGIVGGVVIGMLSAILLVMFIIYRMRKKDEGSYALEEGPRKSPSHAYTRVSSREFFA
jgi:hypothetical protein